MVRQAGIFLFLALLWPLAGLAGQIEAYLDRNPVAEDETVTLTIRATGDTGGTPQIDALRRDFEIVSQAQSSSFQIINGRVSRHREWQFVLAPRHAGTITIPPIPVGDEYSPAIRLKVEPVSSSNTARSMEGFRLELLADTQRPWVGQQVLVTLRLYYRVDFDKGEIGEPEIAEGKGELRPLGKESRYRKDIGGQTWLVYEKRYLLIPEQPGRLQLNPVEFKAVRYPGGGSLFSPSLALPRTLRLHSAPLALDVQPAPPHHGDWLPARSVRLEQNWEGTTNARAGEPVTRTITLTAEGLPANRLPELLRETPTGVRAYPDKPVLDDQEGADGITGVRREQVTYIPEHGGEIHFPEVKIYWWNTKTGREEVASVPGLTLKVTGAPAPATRPAAAATQAPASTPAAERGTDSAPALAAVPDIKAKGPWPWISAALATGWLLTLLAWLRSRKRTGGKAEPASPPSGVPDSSEVKRACRDRDWRRLRNALMAWGRSRWPQDPPHDLYTLGARCGAPLASVLEEINRLEATGEDREWPCKALLEAFRACKKQNAQGNGGTGLPPLYPASGAEGEGRS
ncbi:MAG: protein BatD [Gammaproteobacteria bacterium]|nr:MAG: protein BatD [Gammaproteobacteria bacterium]